jgi:hypothetical protein
MYTYIHNPGRGAGERANVCIGKGEKGYKERKGNKKKENSKMKCAKKSTGRGMQTKREHRIRINMNGGEGKCTPGGKTCI